MNTIEQRVADANYWLGRFRAANEGENLMQTVSALVKGTGSSEPTRYFELSRERKRQGDVVSRLQGDRIRLAHELEQIGLNLDYYQPYMARAIELRDKTEGTLVEGNEVIAFTQFGPVIQRIDFIDGDDSSARKMESRTIEGMIPDAEGLLHYVNASQIPYLKEGSICHKYSVISRDAKTLEFVKIDSSLNLGAHQDACNIFNSAQDYFGTLCPQMKSRTIKGRVPNADGILSYLEASEIPFVQNGSIRQRYLVTSVNPLTNELSEIDSSLNLGAYQEASSLFNVALECLGAKTEASASNLEAPAENAAPADDLAEM